MRPVAIRLCCSWLGVVALAALPSAPAVGQNAAPADNPPATAGSRPAGGRPADTAPATRALEASAATSQAATTRPDSFGIDSSSMLQELANIDWRRRKAATERLTQLGEPGKPFIEDLVRTAQSEEARNNAEVAISTINENRVSGPSYITLHLKNATALQAMAQLAPQAFSALPTMPDNLWQTGGFGAVNIDVDHVPFWEVAPKICQQLGVDFRPYQNDLRIMRGGFQLQGISHVEGAFLVVANSLNYTRSRSFGAGNREQTHFAMSMLVYPEPKITVLPGGGNVQIDEAIDDHGNSLIPTRNRAPGFVNYGGFGGGFSFSANLQYPAKNPGTRMVRFRASTTFLVQTKTRTFEINNPADVSNISTVVNGMQVTFREMKAKGDAFEVHMSVPQTSMQNPQFATLQNQLQTRFHLFDAQGNEIDHRGMGSNMDATSFEFTVQFGRNNGGSGAIQRPARLVWDIPLEAREVTVPIRFNDIPLFDDN